MTSYKPGDIVLVRFPFTDLENSKKRPALVLVSAKTPDPISLITIAMVTSQVEGPEFAGDVQLKNWSEAKLIHPSMVRLAKITTVETELIEKTLGKLSSTDIKAVKLSWKKLYHSWLK